MKGQLGSMMPSAEQVIEIFMMVMRVLVTVGIIGGIAFVLLKKKMFTKWTWDVTVFLPNGMEQKLRGRRVSKRDGEVYGELSNGDTFNPPSHDRMVSRKKGRPHLYLFSPIRKQYKIVNPKILGNPKMVSFKLAEGKSVLDFWKSTEYRKADIKWQKKNVWAQLVPFMTVAMIVVGFAVVFYVVFEYGVMPLIDRGTAVNERAIDVLEQTGVLLDKAVEFVTRTPAGGG